MLNRVSIFLVVLLVTSIMATPPTRAADPPPASAPSQKKCPVMTDQDIDPDIYVDYKATRVFFCCPKCKRKFNENPEKYFKLVSDGSLAAPTPGTSQASSSKIEPPLEPRPLVILGRFHPAMTDLPIGALLAALTAELLFMLRRKPTYDSAARFCIWFATLATVVTAPLGWCLGGFHPGSDDTILGVHRWLGSVTLLLMLMLLWTSESARRAPVPSPQLWKRYRFVLFLGTLCILITGFFGGAMVWGIDHYWK